MHSFRKFKGVCLYCVLVCVHVFACVCACSMCACRCALMCVCMHACMCVYVCLIRLSVCECVYVGAYCIICVCVGVTVRHYTLFITHYSFKQNQTQQLQKKYNMQAPFPIHIPIFFSLPFPILYLVLHCKFGIYIWNMFQINCVTVEQPQSLQSCAKGIKNLKKHSTYIWN